MNNNFNLLEFLIPVVKFILEILLEYERQIYLEENKHKTKGNGFYSRNLKTSIGELSELRIPRTRDNQFKSQLIPTRKHATEDVDKLVSRLIYAGVSTRKIVKLLKEIYGTKMSHTHIARMSEIAYETIDKWKKRSLKKEYAVIFLDATMYPIKRDTVEKEAIYVAIGITREGYREILGYWIPGGAESAYNWREILSEMKERGVEKVHFIVSDDLTGMKNQIKEVYPDTKYQTCALHVIRNICKKIRVQHRATISFEWKEIFNVNTKEEAEKLFSLFREKWRKVYPRLVSNLEDKKEDLFTYLELPKEIRKMVYTNNVLERLFKEIKRRLKSMEMFQSESSAEKYLYVLLQEQNERFESRKLKNWCYYFEIYLEKNQVIK